jgi:hypothetical protein
MRYPHICSVFASALRSEHLQHVGQYESVALVFRVIPHEEGIAIRVRRKVRFYETDTLEESTPVPLRPIRDGHFTTGRSFVTFLNPAPTAGCSTSPLASVCTNGAGERRSQSGALPSHTDGDEQPCHGQGREPDEHRDERLCRPDGHHAVGLNSQLARPDQMEHVHKAEYTASDGCEQAGQRQRAHQRQVPLRGTNQVHHGHDERDETDDECQQREQARFAEHAHGYLLREIECDKVQRASRNIVTDVTDAAVAR